MSLDRDYENLQKQMIRLENMSKKEITKNYKDTLDKLRRDIAALYERLEVDGELTLLEMNKYNRLNKLDNEVKEMMLTLYNDNSSLIKVTLESIAHDTYASSIAIVESKKKLLGISKKLDVAAIVNDDMAGLNWLDRMNHHRSNAIYEIQKEIKQGLSQGDTYAAMSKRLKHKLGTDINKANTIIRTEAHRVTGAAKEESFREIEEGGVKFREKWISSNDERVRSAHQELNGVIIKRGEMFKSPTGAEGPGPGLMGTAEDDIGCRCIKTIVLD